MRTLACLIVPVLLAAACGGNVVVDGSAGGTTTETGTQTGTQTQTGAQTQTGTSTQIAGVALCVKTCEAVAMACPGHTPLSSCQPDCAKQAPAFEAACPQAYEGFLSCIAQNPTKVCQGTLNGTVCQNQLSAFLQCTMTVCADTPSTCM